MSARLRIDMGLVFFVYPETLIIDTVWFIPETITFPNKKDIDGQDRCPVYPETSGFRWRSIQWQATWIANRLPSLKLTVRPWKWMGGRCWKMNFLLGWPIFRCHVSFREGIDCVVGVACFTKGVSVGHGTLTLLPGECWSIYLHWVHVGWRCSCILAPMYILWKMCQWMWSYMYIMCIYILYIYTSLFIYLSACQFYQDVFVIPSGLQ